MKLRIGIEEQGTGGMHPSSVHSDMLKSFSPRLSIIVVCCALGGGMIHMTGMLSTTGNNNYVTEYKSWWDNKGWEMVTPTVPLLSGNSCHLKCTG